MTTAHGGFYINCGALEFKTTDKNSLLSNRNNITNHDDESGESSQDTDAATKRSKKRLISTSDEDDDEDIASDHSRKVNMLNFNVIHDKHETLLYFNLTIWLLIRRNKD